MDMSTYDNPEGFDSSEDRGEARKTGAQGQFLIPPGPWHEFPAFWDVLRMAGKDWPGIAKVDSVSRQQKWDTAKAKGSHGGTRKFAGADLATVSIVIVFWDSEQWDAIQKDFLPLVEPDPGKDKPAVLDVSHAVLEARKIKQVTVDGVDGPSVDGGFGTITIQCTEYRAPSEKNATGTAQSNQGKKTNGGNSKNNSRCQELAARYEQLQADNAQQQAYINTTIQLEGDSADVEDRERQIDNNNVEMARIAEEQRSLGCGGQTQAKPSASGASDPP